MSPPNLLLVKLERKLSHVPTTIFEEKTTIMKNNTDSLGGQSFYSQVRSMRQSANDGKIHLEQIGSQFRDSKDRNLSY